MYSRPACFVVALTLLTLCNSHGDLMPRTVHAPEFPLKTKRMLVSDAEIEVARKNVQDYKAAKGIADKIIKRADGWMAWDDQALRNLVPTADVTRAFNVGTAGCPSCGQDIYEKGGTYPWIIDPKTPFKVTCPVDGNTYPSNDYAAYYASGLKDKALLTGDYADDGWGWVGPDGERYWFVAYANHWTWRNHIVPAVQYLGRAHILTGEAAYGRKAAVLLDRIAEVYPDMEYHEQSRYGQMQGARGGRYEGKIINWIWATGMLTMLSEAYDFSWDTIDDNTVPGKSSEEVRKNIEANLLEEGIRGYFSGRVRGNFGMHQKALVYAGLARQHGKQDEWFDGLLNDAGSNYRMTGLNYALYNLVYRDGPPYETSPGYNFSWVVNLTTVAEALERAGYPVYANPKMRRLYDGVLDIVNAGAFTPSLGDSGGIHGGLVGRDAFVYQSAYRAYGDPRYLSNLEAFNAVGEKSFARFESLFTLPVAAKSIPQEKAVSRLLDGYGMAILNNPADTVSLALHYGYRGGHSHFDILHFELFANDLVMMPDTGYPDFMNAYVPGIYSWSKNTITHNTLVVDASRQTNNRHGVVKRFLDEDFARVLDVDASDIYEQTEVYRRRVMMIDFDEESSYVLDYFQAQGGDEHDYSLHGPPGTFTALSGTWSDPATGTLAGEDVAVGHLYDDPERAVEGFSGGYSGYQGSGFQHLVNAQRLTDGTVAGEWVHERDENAKLRVHRLDASAETILADAQVSPVKHKQILKYLIARNQGETVESDFVSVIEPFNTTAKIEASRSLPLSVGTGIAAEIRWQKDDTEMRDVVLMNNGDGIMRLADPSIHTDTDFAIVRYTGKAVTQRWFAGGTYLTVVENTARRQAHPRGEVTKVNPEKGQIHVRGDIKNLKPETLVGEVVHFENALRRTAHTIKKIETAGAGFIITVRDDLHVGHVRISAVEAQGLRTPTGLSFAPVYNGTYVTDPAYGIFLPLKQVQKGLLELIAPLPDAHPFEVGEDAWIINIGPGDQCEIPSVTVLP
jgi:oligo-alginate lyase